MTLDQGPNATHQIIGLIPAGGHATRIGPLPCSKEIYPIGFESSREGRPKAICYYLLEKMRLAGVHRAYIILREGKWDIPAYLRDGKMLGVHLAYLIMDVPFGVPFTIDQAFPFVQEATIAFGFPDIYFEQDDAFIRLLDSLGHKTCDVVLGLFPSDRPDKADMVDIDAQGKIRDIVIKPQKSELHFTWGAAVWNPVFSQFMHNYVQTQKEAASGKNELFIGEVVKAAIHKGVRVEAVQLSTEPFLDIGTPDDLLKAARLLMAQTHQKRS